MKGAREFEYATEEAENLDEITRLTRSRGRNGWRVHTFTVTQKRYLEGVTDAIYTVLFERRVPPKEPQP